jgi:hypothetical protein
MKNAILLVGLAVVSATVYGLNHRIGGCAEPPNPTGNHVTEHNKTVLATRFDVEIASSSFIDVLGRYEQIVSNANPGAEEFAIRIFSKDLQFEGITQNQQIRNLKFKQETLANILTATVRQANPDQRVRDPSDARQKLVWTVGADPADSEKQSILITTRNGAEAKGLRLPAVFLSPDERDQAILLVN